MKLPVIGRERRRRLAVRDALVHGRAADVACPLRLTSARGWGPWTEATVRLGDEADGMITWQTDDPVAAGLPAMTGPVEAQFRQIDDAWLRPVRFKTEAFSGMDARILVLTSERTTYELAPPPELAEPMLMRMRLLLDLDATH